ncbi:hypothetical protein [Oceaniglobus ichthyenteri]|uniref:hypothetical protein n=1 Tax=Oceaniglobus ichthyenteri TaxID=2136177 RepID=UPI000D3697E8|nr:hypothetical protein [Oceaniglobus ichthyenteri]
MFKFDHPFYKPLWRRIAITAFCALWAMFELSMGAHVWAMIFAALAGLTAYHFFIVWKDD